MAAGRVLVVHEAGATRANLVELLTREGLRAEAVESSFECMARFVDEPAELVIVGLGGLDRSELRLVEALRAETPAPRILVLFPSPARDLAVSALRVGAHAYVLEPYYADELLGVVRGLRRNGTVAAPAAEAPDVDRLVAEIAHTINNPLQIVGFLLEKERVTKKELLDGLPPSLERIRRVVQYLREFADVPRAAPEAADVRSIAEQVAQEARCAFRADEDLPRARVDAGLFRRALVRLLDAVRARIGDEAEPVVRVARERDRVAVRVTVAREAFAGERTADLLDMPFVVRKDREVLPSLALPRRLLEAQGGDLVVEHRGEELQLAARVPTE